VTGSLWNPFSPATSGVIGFGLSSPVWASLWYPDTKKFSIYMTNFNDPTFAQPDYVATTSTSVLNFNGVSSDYVLGTDASANFTAGNAKSVTTDSTTFEYVTTAELGFFGFGYTNFTDADDIAEYYREFIFEKPNPLLELSFIGLGLPAEQYAQFSALLKVISNGQNSCLQKGGSFCVMTQQCSAYTDLGIWDYSFKLNFTESYQTQNYIRVPLSTFAKDVEIGGQTVCGVFIEMLSPEFVPQSPILGSMFFQNIYTQFESFNEEEGANEFWNVTMFVNKNAIQGTYIGDAVYPESESPFNVNVYNLVPINEHEGLPSFSASIYGIDSESWPN
jgi:hypothetical protein